MTTPDTPDTPVTEPESSANGADDTDEEEATSPADLLRGAADKLAPMLEFVEQLMGSQRTITIEDAFGGVHTLPAQVPAINELRGLSALRALWDHPDAVGVVNQFSEEWKGGWMPAILWLMERAAADPILGDLIDNVVAGFHADLEDGRGKVIAPGLISRAHQSARKYVEELGGDPEDAPRHVLHLFRSTQIVQALAPFLGLMGRDLQQWTGGNPTP